MVRIDPQPDPESLKMSAWLGHNIHEAISAFGPPTDTYENGGTTMYTWMYQGPAVAYAGRIGSGFMATSNTSSCREWLDVRDEMVVGWHWQGRCGQ